jgi:hypothetical protein|tara:strand:- start:7185 stop:7376 length:192 start_codon:yes stop_codon:yes gene_type:complete
MKNNELKLHPSYWTLHKKFWQEEYDNLDKEVANNVMQDPQGDAAWQLEKKVTSKIRENLLRPA